MGLWGASFLTSVKGLTAESAAGWVSLFFLGITIGRFLSGLLVAKLSNEKMILFGGCFTIAGLLLLLLPLPNYITYIGFLGIGLGLSPIFPGLLHQTPAYFGTQHAQALMGMQMAVAYTGTMLLPPILGFVLERTSFLFFPYILLAFALLMLALTQILRRQKAHSQAA